MNKLTVNTLKPEMKFEEYQHIEKFGTEEVIGIDVGLCYIFPKIDGSNGSVWTALGQGGQYKTGSRKREIVLGMDQDNQGFAEYISNHSGIKRLLQYGYFRLFGEWLVPHTLKTYRDDAWRKFYVFDVMNHEGVYFTYDEYKPILDFYGINYITPLEVINNPTHGDLMRLMDQNTFLMKDGHVGEGIVIKNYNFVNKYGRVTWAKMVRNEFKDQHKKENRIQVIERSNLEYEIVQKFLTESMVDKIVANIIIDQVWECKTWDSKSIPRLLQTAYYDLVRECMWNIVKDFKNPTIDFKKLQFNVINRVKELRKELF
jgi:hypothetical protein